MKWIKHGLVFKVDNLFDWAQNSALQPTPIVLKDKIRVYVGMRDNHGVSRVGFVDFDVNNPYQAIGYSKKPCLDIGMDGSFDDNGVVPSAVVQEGESIRLYYAGYQLVKKVRFLVLCGLAISTDGGDTFKRYKTTPVLERTNSELLFRVIHTIWKEDDIWRIWYGGGNHFIQGKNKTLPVYDIRYMESKDGINFPESGETALEIQDNEYRIGRPFVIKNYEGYEMFFGASTEDSPYRLAHALSQDGRSWIRDNDFGIDYTPSDFDSEMSAYPGIVSIRGKIYMYYNGNNYGYQGIGLVELK